MAQKENLTEIFHKMCSQEQNVSTVTNAVITTNNIWSYKSLKQVDKQC